MINTTLLNFLAMTLLGCGSQTESISSGLLAEDVCGDLSGVEVHCPDFAGKFNFLFNDAAYRPPFPLGLAGESSVFNSKPHIGELSYDIDFKAANPPVWVNSGRTPGVFVNGPNWQSELNGSITAEFAVGAVVYQHEYTTNFLCLSGDGGCRPQMRGPGPNVTEPVTSAPNIKIGTVSADGTKVWRPIATISPDTEMFRIEITSSGGLQVLDHKTVYWRDFSCVDPVPFPDSRPKVVNAPNDGTFPMGPMWFAEKKRTPCVYKGENEMNWAGLGHIPMRMMKLNTDISAGVRGVELRTILLYPYYDFYVLFGQVFAHGYKG